LSELRPVIRVNVCLCAENQLVLVGYQLYEDFSPHHSIHLHGHGFAVMAMGFERLDVDEGVNNSDIVCDSTLCAVPSWNTSRDL